MSASLTFLSPSGALLCLAAVVPVAALVLVTRRVEQVDAALGLSPASRRPTLLRALALAAVLVLLGVASARPALRTTEGRSVRTDAEAFFVIDVSRSMLAGTAPGRATRLQRANAIALQLRASMPEVPAGLAGLTDRALPYVFPTADPRVFARVLARSVDVDAPPPREVSRVGTSFDALGDLQRRGFFRREARARLCVLITDGESRPFDRDEVGRTLLASPPCRLVVVRVGSADERIYGRGGRPESQYLPLDTAESSVETLAAATGGQAFAEDETTAAERALASLAGSGPTTSVGEEPRTTELAPWLALAAALLVLLLVAPPLLGDYFVANAQRTDYDLVETR